VPHSGQTVGNIRLLELLGIGGMGEVWVGQDERLQRRVAVKALRAEHRMDESVKRRFLREARILSQLEHPNICRLYDYVEQDDADYIVLELVHGQNLRETARQGLSLRDKLTLAAQVADALVAAHSMSVVHRDLKPENVLVDANHQVKVLDFGLARSLPPPGGDARPATGPIPIRPLAAPGTASGALLTMVGDVMGTPRYMSPEQARGEPVTAASDMYSLGLVLQELFTGRPPYEPGLDLAVLRQKAAWGETVAVQGTDAQVAALLDQLKAFSPSERPSAVTAAERLRWILDTPRRRMRRRLGVLVIACLALSAVVSSLGLVHARRSLTNARQAQAEAEAVNRFLRDMLSSADPGERGIDIRVVDVLDQAAAQVDSTFADHPVDRAAVHNTLGNTYGALGAYDKALAEQEKAAAIRIAVLGPDHPTTLVARQNVGLALKDLGRFDEAEAILGEVLEARRRVLGPDHPETNATLGNLAGVYQQQGRFQEAEPLMRANLELSLRTLGPRHRDTLVGKNNLAITLQRLGRDAEAEVLQREVLSARTEELGEGHPLTLSTLGNLAVTLAKQAKYEEAEAMFRRSLELNSKLQGEEHPHTLSTMGNLAIVLVRLGKTEEAVELAQRALEASRRVVGEDHPQTITALGVLANALVANGDAAGGEAMQRQALAAKERVLGPDHPNTLASVGLLAESLRAQGASAEAEALLRRLIEARSRVLGPSHPDTVESLRNLADLLRETGHSDQAAQLEAEAAAASTAPGE